MKRQEKDKEQETKNEASEKETKLGERVIKEDEGWECFMKYKEINTQMLQREHWKCDHGSDNKQVPLSRAISAKSDDERQTEVWGSCSILLFQPLSLAALGPHQHLAWDLYRAHCTHPTVASVALKFQPWDFFIFFFNHITALPGWQWNGWVAKTSQNIQVFCLIRGQGLGEGGNSQPTMKQGHKLWTNIQVPWKTWRTTSILTALFFFQKPITLYNSDLFHKSPNPAQTCRFLCEYTGGVRKREEGGRIMLSDNFIFRFFT